ASSAANARAPRSRPSALGASSRGCCGATGASPWPRPRPAVSTTPGASMPPLAPPRPSSSSWPTPRARSRVLGVPPSRIGPYEVVREVGRGGMGVVLEVRHPGLPRRLALKLITLDALAPEALERFAREARLLARVSHANVVAVHTFEK